MGGIYTKTFYKGWYIYRSSIGSQSWVAKKHGVTVRANTIELLHTVIDQHEEDSKKPWMPWGREEESIMKKITREDVEKYGTEDEKKILEDWSEEEYDRKYTVHDAEIRVRIARSGSLSHNHITYRYLTTLRSQVYEWLEKIEETISRYKKK